MVKTILSMYYTYINDVISGLRGHRIYQFGNLNVKKKTDDVGLLESYTL